MLQGIDSSALSVNVLRDAHHRGADVSVRAGDAVKAAVSVGPQRLLCPDGRGLIGICFEGLCQLGEDARERGLVFFGERGEQPVLGSEVAGDEFVYEGHADVGQDDASYPAVLGAGGPCDQAFGGETIDLFGDGAGGDHEGLVKFASRLRVVGGGPAQGGEDVEVALSQPGSCEGGGQRRVHDACEAVDAPDDEHRGRVEVGAQLAPLFDDLADCVHARHVIFRGRCLCDRSDHALTGDDGMTGFVLVPGACHGGWWYEPLASALERNGHRALPLTLSGLDFGDCAEAGRVTLEDHVAEVGAAVSSAVRRTPRVILVGHSYAGSVITAVADRLPDAVSALVYLDAFVPEDGDSCFSMTNDEQRRWYIDGAGRTGLAVEPMSFFDPRARPHPLATLIQKCRLTGAWRSIEVKHYVAATGWPGESPFASTWERVRAEPGWNVHEWETRHNVMRDGPDRVLRLLLDIAGHSG